MAGYKLNKLVHQEWKVSKQIVSLQDETVTNRDELPPVFKNIPRSTNRGAEIGHTIGVPEGFFGFNHCNTKWLLNLLIDGSDFRLQRMLKQSRTRILFETDKYYQIKDQPNCYIKGSPLERPVFNPKALLFMNAFGVAIYLRQYNVLKVLAKQTKFRKPMIDCKQYNYASFVNSASPGDVLIFHFDYLLLKREAYPAIPHLLTLEWVPGDQSKLIYRRRNYQYITPFMDWVDVCRSVLREKPSLQLSKVTRQLSASRSPHFNILELKELGTVMLEYFELRKITKANYRNPQSYGMYAGRKLLHNKEPAVPSEYVKVFDLNPLRPVIPHAASAARRFLAYSYYKDYKNLTTLSQILSVTEEFLKNRYFACDTKCSDAYWHRDPLLFQIFEIVNLREKKDDSDEVAELSNAEQSSEQLGFIRERSWSDIVTDKANVIWYHRFDVLNCISLLFGILQNCLAKNFSSTIIDRICQLMLDILIGSDFVEPIMTYSFYDTYFGLTSLTNCVPALQSSSVMRLLKKAPLLLTRHYSVSQLSDMFSVNFWRTQAGTTSERPKSLEAIGEFLVSRKRLMSMSIMSGEGGEGMSCTSAMGSAGSVIMFIRERERMKEVTQAEEEAGAVSKSDTVKKAQDEVEHIRVYNRMEVDYRYAAMFGLSYRYAVGRNRLPMSETKTMDQIIKDSREMPAF